MFLNYSHLTMRNMVKLLVIDITLQTMTKLVSIAAILLVSTAECERALNISKLS